MVLRGATSQLQRSRSGSSPIGPDSGPPAAVRAAALGLGGHDDIGREALRDAVTRTIARPLAKYGIVLNAARGAALTARLGHGVRGSSSVPVGPRFISCAGVSALAAESYASINSSSLACDPSAAMQASQSREAMRLPISLMAAAAIVALVGCAEEPQTVIAYPAPGHYETRVYTTEQHGPVEPQVAVPEESVRRILILQTRKLDRPAEVVGIVDAHEDNGREAVALDELRRKAAALGADAVVGVEFHHAESHGEPLHLSGLAVRYVSGGAR